MATYFQSNPKIQSGADGLQTLVLMNSDYVQYSDAPPPHHGGNHLFLNSAATVANNTSLLNLPHAPSPHTQQFVGVPLSATAQEPPPPMPHDVSALHGFLPRMQYNLWNTIDPSTAAREVPRASQGLSLSLHGEEVRPSSSSASGASNGGGVVGIQSVLLSSKYLKATQELLDEVVNVNSGIKVEQAKKSFEKTKVVGESSTAASGDGGEGSGKRSSELSTTERQEIQMKKAKLINMLDEVIFFISSVFDRWLHK